MAAARAIADDRLRRRAARGLHHPVGLQPRGRRRRRGRGRRRGARERHRRGRRRDRLRRDRGVRTSRAAMKVAVTGATGLIGSTAGRGAAGARATRWSALSRDPDAGRIGAAACRGGRLGHGRRPGAGRTRSRGGRGGHLAGEPIAQRWSAGAKERIPTSRVVRDGRIWSLGCGRPAAARGAGIDARPPATTGTAADGMLAESGRRPADDFLASRVRRPGRRRPTRGLGARASARGRRPDRRRARPRGRRAREDAAAVPGTSSVARSPAGGSTCRGSARRRIAGIHARSDRDARPGRRSWTGPVNALCCPARRPTVCRSRRARPSSARPAGGRCAGPRAARCEPRVRRRWPRVRRPVERSGWSPRGRRSCGYGVRRSRSAQRRASREATQR